MKQGERLEEGGGMRRIDLRSLEGLLCSEKALWTDKILLISFAIFGAFQPAVNGSGLESVLYVQFKRTSESRVALVLTFDGNVFLSDGLFSILSPRVWDALLRDKSAAPRSYLQSAPLCIFQGAEWACAWMEITMRSWGRFYIANACACLSPGDRTVSSSQFLFRLFTWRRHTVGQRLAVPQVWAAVSCWLAVGNGGCHGAGALIAPVSDTERGERWGTHIRHGWAKEKQVKVKSE